MRTARRAAIPAPAIDQPAKIKTMPDESNLEDIRLMLQHALEWRRTKQLRMLMTLLFAFDWRTK